jgi:hypothetical protein
MGTIRALAALAAGFAFPATLLANDLPSQWRAGGVTSDPFSWAGVPFEREAGLDVGAVNDADYLWLCLYPSSHRVEYQLVLGGATVWVLDDDGDRVGGVRFRLQTPPGEAPIVPSEGPNDAPDPHDLRERVDRFLPSFDVLDRDGDLVETRARAQAGEVNLRVEASEFVYFVVRIPLARVEAALLAVGSEPGTTIGLGVETPRLERPIVERPPVDEGDPRANGGEPGGDRPPGGPYFVPPDPIRFWTVLQLASPGGSGGGPED